MTGRQDTAYLTPAAVILGLGIHASVSSIYLLVTKAGASKTPIWRVACLVWFILIGFITVQFIALDYVSVPYVVPNYWFGLIQFLNYGFNYLVSIGVGVMLLMRIQIFFSSRSPIFISMMIMFVLVIIFKGLGDGYGMIVSYDVMNTKYLMYTDDPLFTNSPRYMAIGQGIEAIFSSTGSIAFLYALGQGLGKSNMSILASIVFKYEGLSLVAIICLNLIIAGFAISISIYDFTYITHTALYMPSWTYALQFYTFLKHSYVDAKAIIEENSATLNKSSSGGTRNGTITGGGSGGANQNLYRVNHSFSENQSSDANSNSFRGRSPAPFEFKGAQDHQYKGAVRDEDLLPPQSRYATNDISFSVSQNNNNY